ncbi:MAG TPA: hypothetical protein VMJ32_02620, partial [Pirellulales bacterium]|nr:hypothetical protein [Pirellulales bacterium]
MIPIIEFIGTTGSLELSIGALKPAGDRRFKTGQRRDVLMMMDLFGFGKFPVGYATEAELAV